MSEIDYSKKRVDDLRHDLIHTFGLTEEVVANIKGKENLVSAHKAQYMVKNKSNSTKVKTDSTPSDEYLDTVEFVEPTPEENSPNTTYSTKCGMTKSFSDEVPNYHSPEWADYVLTHLDEKELIDGQYPSIVGLRRISEKLLGSIVQSGPIQLQSIVDESQIGRANCIFEIMFDWKISDDGNTYDGALTRKVFRAAAGASVVNVDNELFRKFPEAMAETRAEARALRRALKLNCVAYEELIEGKEEFSFELADVKDGEYGNLIKTNQKLAISSMCNKLNIDVDKLLQKYSVVDIKNCTREKAEEILTTLNEYQNSSKNSQEVPEEIKK